MNEDLFKELEDYAVKYHVPIIKQDSLGYLEDVIKKLKPKKILEIGTAIGYSGSKMLNVAPNDCKLYTIELNSERIIKAKDTFKRAGYENKVEIWEGDAIEIVRYMSINFDLVLLDGPKSHYQEMLPFLLDSLNKNGILFGDNVLFRGLIEKDGKITKRKRTIVVNMRKYIEDITNNKELETTILDVGDGISISKKL